MRARIPQALFIPFIVICAFFVLVVVASISHSLIPSDSQTSASASQQEKQGNGSLSVSFDIRNGYNPHHVLNDDQKADVFYHDRITLVADISGPENVMITDYHWTFSSNSSQITTREHGPDLDILNLIVGHDHLYSHITELQPAMPEHNSDPIEYEVLLTVTTEDNTSHTSAMQAVVYPFAQHTFTKNFTSGKGEAHHAKVDLVWRGFRDEVASSPENISVDTPVFVHINDSIFPDPNLHNRGGIGFVYSVSTEGCFHQNGTVGFVEASVNLPINLSKLKDFGVDSELVHDLALEYYHPTQKRFFPVNDFSVMFGPPGLTTYGVGTLTDLGPERERIFTIIVDSIYNRQSTLFRNTARPPGGQHRVLRSCCGR